MITISLDETAGRIALRFVAQRYATAFIHTGLTRPRGTANAPWFGEYDFRRRAGETMDSVHRRWMAVQAREAASLKRALISVVGNDLPEPPNPTWPPYKHADAKGALLYSATRAYKLAVEYADAVWKIANGDAS